MWKEWYAFFKVAVLLYFKEKRKTITGEDLIVAFQTLGFDDYVDPLREFLTKYREANKVQSNKGVEVHPFVT